MLQLHLSLITAVLFLMVPARADDPVYSGPQPGERISPFKVFQFAGPNAGEELQLLADEPQAPCVLIFVHEATRPGLQLMRPLDLYASKLAANGLVAHFVWLTSDRSKTEDWLRNARASLNLKSPINIALDGIEGPGSYGLNRKVTLTILVTKDAKVAANFAVVQPNETDAPKVLSAIAKLMGQPTPTLESLRAELGGGMRRDAAKTATRPAPSNESSKLTDDTAQLIQQLEQRIAEMDRNGSDSPAGIRQVLRLEAQIARLQARDQEHHARAVTRISELEKLLGDLTDALNESRATIAKLEGKPAPERLRKPVSDPPTAEPARRTESILPGRTPSDPEIVALMRRMIQPSNDAATAKEITAAMIEWAGDNAERKSDLVEFAKRIAHLGYGSEPAKQEIKRLTEK